MRRVIATLFICALLGAAAAGTTLWYGYQSLRQALVIDDEKLFTIPSGASIARVTADMREHGLLSTGRWLYWYARMTGQAQALKAGEYQLHKGLTALDALALFVAGDVVLHAITIVEGWTTSQAVNAIQGNSAIAVTPGLDDPVVLLAAVGASEPHAEGLFFPSTYHFGRGTRDVDILRQAYVLMQRELASAWSERVDELPFDTAYEGLILASIIEKETARDDERRRIAGVFVRRLKKKMRLQTDPTVIYGLGADYDGNIRRRDLRADTPYNTYTRAGLTPTPIALPGRASLQAAVNPEPGNSLYFVATGEDDGSHYFSATGVEHEAAVARYLKRLRARRQ